MSSEAGTQSGSGAASLPRSAFRTRRPSAAPRNGSSDCTRTRRVYGRDTPVLEAVLADARRVHAGYADDEVGDGLASVWYAATAIVELGAALELDEADVRGASARRSQRRALRCRRRGTSCSARSWQRETARAPPPSRSSCSSVFLGLDVLTDVSLWTQTSSGLDCIVTLGLDPRPSRRERAEAKATLRGRSRLSLLGGSQLRSAPVLRFGEAHAAVVGRLASTDLAMVDAYLAEIAAALSPVLEREQLLGTRPPRAHTHRIGRAGSCDSLRSHDGRSRRPRARRRHPAPAEADIRSSEDYREQAVARRSERARSSRPAVGRSRTRSRRRRASAGRSAKPSSRDRWFLGACRHPRRARSAIRTRFPLPSGSPFLHSGGARQRPRACRSDELGAWRSAARSRCRSSTTAWASRSSGRWRRRRSAVVSASRHRRAPTVGGTFGLTADPAARRPEADAPRWEPRPVLRTKTDEGGPFRPPSSLPPPPQRCRRPCGSW